MSEWQKVKIGELLKRIKRPVVLENEKEYKLVTIQLHHKGVKLRGHKKGYDIKSKMHEVKTDDFILSGIDARNGAFGIVGDELDGAIVTNDFWYFELNEELIDKHFFLELTSTKWFDEICRLGSDGTTQRIRLQKTKFFNQEIYLPSVDKQKKVSKKFILIKQKKEKFEKECSSQQSILTLLRQQILQDAISGKLTADWRASVRAGLRACPDIEPANKLLEQIKAEKEKLIAEKKIKKEKPLPPISEDEVPFELPEGWEWCRLGEVTKRTGAGSTPRGGKSAYIEGGIKFIRSQNVYNSGLVLDDIVYIPEKTHEKMSNTKVFGSDLLLNITGGSIGRCAIVPSDFDEGNVNQHVSVLRFVDSSFSDFLHKVIISNYFQKEIVNSQTGAGREGLPKYRMDRILIPLPPRAEQKAIVTKVEKLMKYTSQLEKKITQNANNAKTLMQAFLGEIFRK